MKLNSRLNTLIFSPAHNYLRTLKSTSCAFLQPLLFISGCLLLLGLLCLPGLAQVDPTICIDPGGNAVVIVDITASGAALTNFSASLPATAAAIANSCTATVGGIASGNCTIAANGATVNWTGSVAAGQTLNVIYRVRIDPAVANNAVLTINNVAVGGTPIFPATSSITVGCPASTTPNVRVSDQKPGSVLVFPYYTSDPSSMATYDTRISLTNVTPPRTPKAYQAFVHVFLVDGTSCSQTDFFVCLTPGATATFTASDMDPSITGYIIAVAVDSATGLPVQNNILIGNAFVNTPDYFGNYGAESFAANSPNLYVDYGTIAILFFDGVGYDPVPKKFAVEIQSPVDVVAPYQKIITAGLNGDVTSGDLYGAAQINPGQIINDAEDSRSVNNIVTGDCQASGVINDNLRVVGKLSKLIATGKSGTVKFDVGGAVGLLLTPRNTKWGGIRTLHKTATVMTSLTIPVFIPTCPTITI